MTDPDPEHIDTTDTGIAVLADEPDDDLPLRVRGVVLGEGDVTHGASKTRVFWPRETLEAATEALVGTKIADDSAHDLPDEIDSLEDIPLQPPVRSIVGEVTDAQYKPGVGILYEGEIDDPDIASLVQNGRIDVSPFVIRRLGDHDEDHDARRATEILKWRDVATVETGASESASIEPLPATGAAAMRDAALVDALAAAFDDEADDNDPNSDEAAESASGSGDDDPEGDDPDKSDSDGDPGDGVSTSGGSGRDADPDTDSTDMDLTDHEEDLVRTARTLDDPSVVEADAEALADEMESFDDPTVIETDDYEALGERVETVRGLLAEALAERTGMKTETAEALSLGALMSEFENDDGEFDAEALIQAPESGSADEPDDPNGDDPDGTDDTGVDALSDEERGDVRSLLARADTLESTDATYADSLRDDAADLVGVDSHDDIDMEAL